MKKLSVGTVRDGQLRPLTVSKRMTLAIGYQNSSIFVF
jgi:hypothetical protein